MGEKGDCQRKGSHGFKVLLMENGGEKKDSDSWFVVM